MKHNSLVDLAFCLFMALIFGAALLLTALEAGCAAAPTRFPTEATVEGTAPSTVTPQGIDAEPPGVRLYFGGGAQVELVDPQGVRIYVRAGEIDLPGGIHILGLPSAHNEGDAFIQEGGTNYIFIIDIAGLRIAHFGDIGQESLTPEQLEALGNIDVAITQFANEWSDMSSLNAKGIHLMQQFSPRLILPTHTKTSAARKVAELWRGAYTVEPFVSLTHTNLPAETTVLYIGSEAERYGELLGLEAF